MDADVPALVRQYASQGLLVDANILLLFVVGTSNPARIEKFKRTRQFRVEDYRLLGSFLAHFRRRVTTPCVLTEVSNLVSQLGDPDRRRCLETLGREILIVEEHYQPSATFAADELFSEIGLTDCSIRYLANAKFLVLTDDYRLTNRLHSLELPAVNFNHLRSFQGFLLT